MGYEKSRGVEQRGKEWFRGDPLFVCVGLSALYLHPTSPARSFSLSLHAIDYDLNLFLVPSTTRKSFSSTKSAKADSQSDRSIK